MGQNEKIGHVTSGSLTEGFIVKVRPEVNIEQVKTGQFVAIQGSNLLFFSIITNIQLECSNPEIFYDTPPAPESLLHNIVHKQHLFATAHIKPMLSLNSQSKRVSTVKTIPSHFAPVRKANEKDISSIFGRESDKSRKYFNIGKPLEMDTPVCINLEKLIERSSGIFGKTGTGKTFLTRLVISGLIKTEKAATIIFDMHNEYGLQARQEGGGLSFVKGLKTLFPTRVALFSLDPISTQQRGSAPDVTVNISYTEIRIEDILSLQHELNLHTTAIEAAYLIGNKYKKRWLIELLEQGHDAKEFAQQVGAHPESIAALYRKLKRIERLPFITKQTQPTTIIDTILSYIDRNIHIVFEFGNFTSTFCYLLVANIITRRIHTAYIKKTEAFLRSKKVEEQPTRLLIVIEEAHKFLHPEAAKQTIFGTIAREMRKYYVSLCIIDQRPGDIDDEIMSQIGTKIVAQLGNEKDMQTVFSGVPNASTLKSVLSTLDSKKQVLLIGHALPMPMVIETRSYDQQFYQDMQLGIIQQPTDEIIEELF